MALYIDVAHLLGRFGERLALDETLPCADLADERDRARFGETVRFVGEAVAEGEDRLHLFGTLSFEQKGPCDRCLETARQRIDAPVDVRIVAGADRALETAHPGYEVTERGNGADTRRRGPAAREYGTRGRNGSADAVDASSGDLALVAEERFAYPLDGLRFDLEEILREALYFALPTKLLCAEDCPGLCPYCGKKHLGSEACAEESKKTAPGPFDKLRDLL